jgi:CRP-like cAMP-binding protein
MPESDNAPLLAENEWFQELPAAVVSQLTQLATVRHFGDGDLIHAKGDAPDGLYGVRRGQVRISNVGSDGQEILVAVFEPGGWWGEISMFDGLPRTHDAHAIGDTEIILLPQQRFQALLEQQPDLYPHFVKMLCRKLRLAFTHIDDLAFLPLPERIAKQLLNLAEIYGEDTEVGRRIRLHLPQEDLGRMLGASRQSVSKILKRFESQGWVAVAYGQITVCNVQALREASGTP